jgi:predicted Zn-dependent peptidase
MKRLLLMVMMAVATTSALPGQNTGLKLPPYKKLKLPNGTTLLLMERHQVPLVSFQALVNAGPIADPHGQEGVASLTAALLRKGTKTRSAEQFSAALDFMGGQFRTSVAAEYATISAEFMKKDISPGADLLADALLHPTFPQEEVEKLIQQQRDGIKAAKDQALAVLSLYFNAYLYGPHPYARPGNGDERSLPRPDFKRRVGRRKGKVSEESVERGADSCLVIFRSGKAGAFRSRRKLPTQKTRPAVAL